MTIVERKVDEQVVIGEELLVGPTDIDAKSVRLIARGRIIGGPDDGESFTRTAEIGIGGELRLGTSVLVGVVHIRGDTVHLGVQAPKHLGVQPKELFDLIKRKQRDDGII